MDHRPTDADDSLALTRRGDVRRPAHGGRTEPADALSSLDDSDGDHDVPTYRGSRTAPGEQLRLTQCRQFTSTSSTNEDQLRSVSHRDNADISRTHTRTISMFVYTAADHCFTCVSHALSNSYFQRASQTQSKFLLPIYFANFRKLSHSRGSSDPTSYRHVLHVTCR